MMKIMDKARRVAKLVAEIDRAEKEIYAILEEGIDKAVMSLVAGEPEMGREPEDAPVDGATVSQGLSRGTVARGRRIPHRDR